MSPFFAEQLLYDYTTKTLDSARERAIADCLQTSPELAKSLDDIVYGLTYCHHLQKATITPELIQKLGSRRSFFYYLRRYQNFKNWNQGTVWTLEAVGISVLVLVLVFAVPWPRFVKTILQTQPSDPVITSVSKATDPSNTLNPAASPTEPDLLIHTPVIYTNVAEITVVNPDFTAKKLLTILPELGAGIDHHSIRKSAKGLVGPYFRLSLPYTQSEAVFTRLKELGQLTWMTPPPDNKEGGQILGVELWLIPFPDSKK